MRNSSSRAGWPIAVSTLALALLVVTLPDERAAAQGSPGVPQAPVVVFTENFENVSNPAEAEFLDDYVGPPPVSMTYTADPGWISPATCNGLIGSWNSTPGTTGCAAAGYNAFLRPVARALGNAFGGGDDNHIVWGGGGAPATPAATVETVAALPLASTGRFIGFFIDVAATSCGAPDDPLLRFFLLDGTTEIPVNDAAIDPCNSPFGTTVPGGNGGIQVGSYATDAAILVSGSTVRVKLTNDQTGPVGNDYGIDNIRLLDATPQLDKAFADDLLPVDTATTLTFTITNTSELAAKPGWSFTDVLPAGLTIANPANASTTCSGGSIAAPAGGDTIQVSGDLQTGEASCSASVLVTSATSATYINGPDNVTALVGLDPPGTDDVTFFAPVPTLPITVRVLLMALLGGGAIWRLRRARAR